MPEFRPFRGLRYDLATLGAALDAVAAPPYDVIDDVERRELAARDPYNSVRLILPEGDDPYLQAATDLAAWRAAGVLRLDDEPAFYGYTMTATGADGAQRRTRGVLGALAVGEPEEVGILPHERTLPKARSDRLALLTATRANLDPIWGLTPATGLGELLDAPVAMACLDDDGVRHEFAPITDTGSITAIEELVGSAPIVLADGHHRFETAKNFAAGDTTPGAGSVMALVVELAPDELTIRPIHRLITGLPGGTDLRTLLAPSFDVTDAGPNTAEGLSALEERMVADGGLGLVDDEGLAFVAPTARTPHPDDFEPPADDTDAARFEAAVAPLLGDASVDYRGGDVTTIASLVGTPAAQAAMLLRPVSVEQTRQASEAGIRMPQKTTFFWPKPRTGAVFRLLDES
ncbi:MAG: DUF1015 domain-containing protein [Acidimicrobiia bacterium]